MTTNKIPVPNPRYTVQEQPDGFAIIDSAGRDKPYLISRCNTNGVDISDGARRTAEHWAYTWNIVEMGYCGSCEKLRAEVADGKTYPAVGFHSLDRKICFYCACSQED